MKTALFLLATLLYPAFAHAGTMPEADIIQINPRVYALLGPLGLPTPHNQGYMANTTIIIGDQGVILIDSGGSDEVGNHLARTIAKITPKPVTHIINTHHHGDHHLGNIAFKDVEVLSSQQCRKLVEETGDEWVALMEDMIGHKLPNTKPVPASVTFPDESRSDRHVQGVKLMLWVPQGSHTPGDMMVYLPDDKVLIGGDILVNTIVPNLRNAHLKHWIATLEKIQRLETGAIVPGHGPLMTHADVQKLHKMLANLYAGVETGYKRGLNDSEIRATLDLRDWQNLKEFDSAMGGNINHTYLEVEAENF